MDEDLAHQILDELFEHLEDVETQSAAILQFLKAKGLATDEDLAPYLEQASKATSVKWVAERARINYLLDAAARLQDKAAEQKPAQPAETAPNPADTREETNTGKDEQDGKDGQRANNAQNANAEDNAAANTETGKDQSTNDKTKQEKNTRRQEQTANAN
jgi:hypothetical protein